MITRRRREAAEPRLPGGYTIAGYRIEHVLGAGGMGAVYEATQLSLKRRVTLKVIAPGVAVNATVRERRPC
jgi:serine/threonine protein kinase